MPITFIEQDETCSTYQDENGNLVFLAHGSGFRRLLPIAELDLGELWRSFTEDRWCYDKDEFAGLVRELTNEPDDVDRRLRWCDECNLPVDNDAEGCGDVMGGVACDDCLCLYSKCDDCKELVRVRYTTLGGSSVCDPCRRTSYYFCGTCDGYYDPEGDDNHEHVPEPCCVSPAMDFQVRNDGEPPLGNDERVTVTLPAGVISPEGMGAISRYLWHSSFDCDDREEQIKLREVSADLQSIGAVWQTREGNFTKRLSRHAYKVHGYKIQPKALSQVGCIAREHSTAVDFRIEVTRNLNLSAADFSHGDSCWWGGYSESRCALKTNGGFGLRTFDEGGYVSGRAWVLPLRLNEAGQLEPTFETMTPDAFVVFNGYNHLSGYAPARIVSHMAGWTYRKLNFSCSPMYVNSDSGYIVAPEEIAAQYTDGYLSLHLDQHANLFTAEREAHVNVA